MSQAKRSLIASLLAVLASIPFLLSLWSQDQQALSQQLVRLHVIADSDSPEAQEEKLLVRDAVLAAAAPLLKNCSSSRSAYARLEASLPQLLRAAEETSRYPVSLALGREYYPTRVYEDFSLPAGYYQSLQVRLGRAEGRNWWCVVYPPLCQVGIQNLDESSLSLTDQQLRLITEDSGDTVLEFWCLEWLGQLLAPEASSILSDGHPSDTDRGDRADCRSTDS